MKCPHCGQDMPEQPQPQPVNRWVGESVRAVLGDELHGATDRAQLRKLSAQRTTVGAQGVQEVGDAGE